jgi:hypothetical protein
MHVALEELRQISERKDVARLVLYLKELIPDYNPGSPLLKLAMSATTAQAPTVKPSLPVAVTGEWPQPLGTPANLAN